MTYLLDFPRSKHSLRSLSVLSVFFPARWLPKGRLFKLWLCPWNESVPANKANVGSSWRQIWKFHTVTSLQYIRGSCPKPKCIKGEVSETPHIDERVARTHCERACGTRALAVSIFGNYTLYNIWIQVFIESLRISLQITLTCKGENKCL